VIGASPRALAAAVAPAALASLAMAAAVLGLAQLLPLTGIALAALQIAAGALLYVATLRLAFPARLREAIGLVRPQAAI